MYILYADDAGNTGTDYDNRQQPIFTLSGVIVDTDKWSQQNSFINEGKKKILPDFPDCEFHATEIYNGAKCKNGTYDFRKYGLAGNLRIMEQLVDLIVKVELPIITFAVKKANLKNYCKRKYNSSIKIDPYLIAFPYVSLFFDYYLMDKESNGLIFLDEQKPLVTNIDRVLEELRLITELERIEIGIVRIIERALFLDSSKSNFIQLADICNFYINRYVSMENGVVPSEPKATHIRNMYKKLEQLILPPAKDPTKLTEMLKFFDDNSEIFR